MKNSPPKNHYRWIWIYAAVIVLLAGVINLLMWLPIPTFGSLSETSWLGFWGSYLGGALGCLPAIAALIEGRQQARHEHKEREKDRHFSHMPVFDCEIERISDFLSDTFSPAAVDATMTVTGSDTRYSWKPGDLQETRNHAEMHNSYPIYLRLENVGLGPALNTKVSIFGQSPFTIGTFPVGKKFVLLVLLDPAYYHSIKGDLTTTISFEDVLEWRFKQNQSFKMSSDKITFLPISSPKQYEGV